MRSARLASPSPHPSLFTLPLLFPDPLPACCGEPCYALSHMVEIGRQDGLQDPVWGLNAARKWRQKWVLGNVRPSLRIGVMGGSLMRKALT